MKLFLNEEIEIDPKLLLWLGMPENCGNDILIHFLKKDILILPYPLKKGMEDINGISSNVFSVFYDLDEIFKSNIYQKDSLEDTSIELLNNIKKLKGITNVVHYSSSDMNINNLFKDYFCFPDIKINNDPCIMINLIEKINNHFNSHKITRNGLRLNFKISKYPVEILYHSEKFHGYLTNISSKGFGVALFDPDDFDKINLGDFISLTVDFKIINLNIESSIVVRKNINENFLGIMLDTENLMASEDKNFLVLNSIIDTWIKKVIESSLLKLEDFMN